MQFNPADKPAAKPEQKAPTTTTPKRKSSTTPATNTKKQKTIHATITKTKAAKETTKAAKRPKVEEKKKTVSPKMEVKKNEEIEHAKPTVLERLTTNKRIKVVTDECFREETVEHLEIEAPNAVGIDTPKKLVAHKHNKTVQKEAVEATKGYQGLEVMKRLMKNSRKHVVMTEKEEEEKVKEKLQKQKEEAVVYTPMNEETVDSQDKEAVVFEPVNEQVAEDSPSPPSFLTEPSTPPPISAPYKTYLTVNDKERIEREITTLTKLRKALDIIITDRLARNRPSLYHNIEPVLRISTGKTITIAHVCKIMCITPKLYTLQAKEIRDFGNKVTEAFLIEFGKDWPVPLAGKDLQMRSDMLQDALIRYFATHKEPDATVPQIELPKLAKVVETKEWMKEAKLPPGIKSLLEAHQKAKAAAIESEKPKPKPTGSVKDRMAALKARVST